MRLRWVAGLASVSAVAMAPLMLAPMMMAGTMGAAVNGGSAGSSCVAEDPDPKPVPTLDAGQNANAATIIATGRRLEVPEFGLVVSIATAMQESTLHNLDGGDRDSVGLFQQRSPWGSRVERTTAAISAELFFTGGRGGQRGLMDIPGWEGMSVSAAAQAVQVSAFPLAYAKWEPLARKVVGGAPEEVPCDEPAPESDGPCSGGSDLTRFRNGRIPASALCPLPFARGEQLRADAANAAIELSAAYKVRFGKALCVTDSYRTLAEQIDVYRRKPGLAAKPGTSNHGWGVAMDLCGGIQSFGSTPHLWMKAHADTYGWVHPAWAQAGGSKPEAWHWEFEG